MRNMTLAQIVYDTFPFIILSLEMSIILGVILVGLFLIFGKGLDE